MAKEDKELMTSMQQTRMVYRAGDIAEELLCLYRDIDIKLPQGIDSGKGIIITISDELYNLGAEELKTRIDAELPYEIDYELELLPEDEEDFRYFKHVSLTVHHWAEYEEN